MPDTGGRTEGIACREVEYYDIIQLHLAQTLHTAIVPMGPLDITLTFHNGQRVLRQRHCQRCLRNTGTVADFRYEQVVTRQQRFLQRARWNHVILEEELIDEIDGHQGKYQCIDPRHHELHRLLSLLPPLPFDLLRDVDVVDKRYDKQSPPALYPIEEQQIEYEYDDKLSPLDFRIEFFLFLHDC